MWRTQIWYWVLINCYRESSKDHQSQRKVSKSGDVSSMKLECVRHFAFHNLFEFSTGNFVHLSVMLGSICSNGELRICSIQDSGKKNLLGTPTRRVYLFSWFMCRGKTSISTTIYYFQTPSFAWQITHTNVFNEVWTYNRWLMGQSWCRLGYYALFIKFIKNY